MSWEGQRGITCDFCHAFQNGVQLKTYELFISGIFYLIISDCV
jgi:hypothetical protein